MSECYQKKCPQCDAIWEKCSCATPERTIQQSCPTCEKIDGAQKARKVTR